MYQKVGIIIAICVALTAVRIVLVNLGSLHETTSLMVQDVIITMLTFGTLLPSWPAFQLARNFNKLEQLKKCKSNSDDDLLARTFNCMTCLDAFYDHLLKEYKSF